MTVLCSSLAGGLIGGTLGVGGYFVLLALGMEPIAAGATAFTFSVSCMLAYVIGVWTGTNG